MAELLFDELKRYVKFTADDEALLRSMSPLMTAHYPRIADVFYRRILDHEQARTALEGGESRVGKLKITLQQWMRELFEGPWDNAYYEKRARIGRVHVRIALPQHYMFGAMNVLRLELEDVIAQGTPDSDERTARRRALNKMLDIETAIMLHTYREDLLSQQARVERLSTFGQLVGSIGHELRNPLGVIETSLFVLKGRVGGDERAVKHVDRIAEQVRIANDIITQLLDMIRDRPLQRQPVALQEIIAQAAADLQHPPGVKVVLAVPETLPRVNGDPVQLRQIIVNLIQNGIQAAAPDGEVRVTGDTTPGYVDIAVEDTGQGVDPGIRARLFEPLVTNKQKGIGLGLALVKRIIERHGGTVAYSPRQEAGAGARFVVRLPAMA